MSTSHQALRKFGILVCLALASIAMFFISNYLQRADAVPVEPLVATSSAGEVLNFAEAYGNSWNTIHVKGHTAVNGTVAPFETWVRKPASYRSEEGGDIIVGNDKTQTMFSTNSKKARSGTLPDINQSEQEALDQRMNVHRAEDPVLAREGELVVATPVNDLINPRYFVRKELKLTAKAVETVGLRKIAGRQAIQLKVTFPSELAKEDYWDVFVDTKTGILLGLVVHPLPGNPKYETFIDELEVDASVSSTRFDTNIPPGFAVE